MVASSGKKASMPRAKAARPVCAADDARPAPAAAPPATPISGPCPRGAVPALVAYDHLVLRNVVALHDDPSSAASQIWSIENDKSRLKRNPLFVMPYCDAPSVK